MLIISLVMRKHQSQTELSDILHNTQPAVTECIKGKKEWERSSSKKKKSEILHWILEEKKGH